MKRLIIKIGIIGIVVTFSTVFFIILAQAEREIKWVDVSSLATSGTGTQADPWIGWVSSLNSSSTKIFYFRGGEYFKVQKGEKIVPKTGMAFIGDGASSVIYRDDSEMLIEVSDIRKFLVCSVTLQNNATYSDYLSLPVPKNAKFHNLIHDVSTLGSKYILIINSVLDGGYTAIRPNHSSSWWIVANSEIKNQKSFGVMSDSSHLIVTENYFHDIGEDTADTTFFSDGHGHHTHAIYLNALDNQTMFGANIKNNIFTNNTGVALQLVTGSLAATIRDVIIAENQFYSNAKYQQFSLTSTRFRDDILIATTSTADSNSKVENVIVTNNSFLGAAIPPTEASPFDWQYRAAIQILGKVINITIQHNIADNYLQFFIACDGWYNGYDNWGMENIYIVDNQATLLRELVPSTDVGSAIYWSTYQFTNLQISGNTFTESSSNGIYLKGVTQKGCSIFENTFNQMGENASSAFSAIKMYGVSSTETLSNCIIFSNMLTGGSDRAKDGIRIESYVTDLLIVTNTISNFVRYGINIPDPNENNIALESNIFFNNLVDIHIRN